MVFPRNGGGGPKLTITKLQISGKSCFSGKSWKYWKSGKSWKSFAGPEKYASPLAYFSVPKKAGQTYLFDPAYFQVFFQHFPVVFTCFLQWLPLLFTAPSYFSLYFQCYSTNCFKQEVYPLGAIQKNTGPAF